MATKVKAKVKAKDKKANAKTTITVKSKTTVKATARRPAAKPKTKSGSATKRVVKTIIERHSGKPKTNKSKAIPKKGAKKMQTTTATVKTEAPKPTVRRRLRTGGPSLELRNRSKAFFEGHRYKVTVQRLKNEGKDLSVTMTVPVQRYLALQVRTPGEDWGTLRALPINQYTPKKEIDRLREELKNLQIGWAVTDYFGSDAQFRICEVTQEGYRVKY